MTLRTRQLKQQQQQQQKLMGCRKSSPKREAYSNTILPQERRKTSNSQHSFIPKTTGKRKPPKLNPKTDRRKEIIKIWEELNEKERKETIVKINKTKSWFFDKINKIDKPLYRLIRKEREKNEISKTRNKKGEVTTDNAEI